MRSFEKDIIYIAASLAPFVIVGPGLIVDYYRNKKANNIQDKNLEQLKICDILVDKYVKLKDNGSRNINDVINNLKKENFSYSPKNSI